MDYESALKDIRDMENEAWEAMGRCRIYEVDRYRLFLDQCRDLRIAFSQRLKERACAAS